ncbi:sialate O-acetylesterase [Pedobacter sp. FW305-3-2-15-E-R2A2]|uniref:sialate O-acetylesterase n=1 Tax=Pedobacter sp. FW305-3-2-15-E-R2A2 TaxID=3140251 RepID=UPI00314028C0
MSQIKQVLFFLCFSLFLAFQGYTQIRLPKLICDSMVLQRDVELKIWGWASPGERINISFNGKKSKTVAGVNGKWLAKFPAMKAGGPFNMELKGRNTIVLKDILIGDVWLCAGQSNMVHQMKVHNITYAADISGANYPQIRQYRIPTVTGLTGPLEDLPQSHWKSANPKDINDFSVLAYFFAKQIFTKYGIPIGIINSSVGGTTIESWTSEDGLMDIGGWRDIITRNKDTAYVNGVNRRALSTSVKKNISTDQGLTGSVKWYDPQYVPKGWRNINIPGYWEDQGIRDLDGVVWYRREFDIPAAMVGVPALVHLGRIVDADRFYINGQQVGSTGYQYPQRRYHLDPGVLKTGKNIFVIRVENSSGKGGFVPDKPYFIEAGDQSIDLKGDWRYKVGEVYLPAVKPGPYGISEQAQPTALYNAMIAPLTNYGLKGVLWYQGESNVGNAGAYKELLPALIMDWRNQFARPDLPFYYVQLPNHGDMRYQPAESNLALLREASLQTLKVPLTGMAVTIDLGEWNDIHPDNKKDVGDRLALIARHFTYGEKDLVYSGPVFQSSEIKGNQIVVSFNNVGSGLTTNDGEPLSQFEIAAEDKKFVWASAKIEGTKVVVWSDQIARPKYVRYAWADNPVNPNLYNLEKLPASPFRTDK